ncbi:FKBP-type peptidyl-prolyl cis-trans isomerase [Kangiella shandongensis]|uniref:FKBP-type peptidyl-prolyl cis-trans isomerase n=1 Tax=Kangiella shandongensis TaxID=2763258 RepID=UPI001CBC4A56|nr:peptidylprolyl isomerase [Kangiella shandongensis]
MKIEKNSVVELDYKLMDLEGNIWESSDEGGPWVYLHGHGEVMPGLENELLGKAIGQKVKVEFGPEEAYGPYEEELKTEVPREAFAEVKNLTEGMRLAAESSDGVHAVMVREIRDDVVVIDANHPLAGQAVKVEVKVLSVRPGTEDEIAHGHVHQDGTCGH